MGFLAPKLLSFIFGEAAKLGYNRMDNKVLNRFAIRDYYSCQYLKESLGKQRNL